jgi:hypothetical protein
MPDGFIREHGPVPAATPRRRSCAVSRHSGRSTPHSQNDVIDPQQACGGFGCLAVRSIGRIDISSVRRYC